MSDISVMKAHAATLEEAMRLNSWTAEQKEDGTRTIRLADGRLMSPERESFKTDRFGHIVRELAGIDAVLDGELVMPENSNVFEVSKKENWSRVVYSVFDVLEYGGQNLRHLPLLDRQKYIPLITAGKLAVRPIRQFGSVAEGWEAVKKEGLEGLIIKNPNSSYVEARSRNWLKVKNKKDATIEITGHEEGSTHGTFLFENGRLGALSDEMVARYRRLAATGKVFADIQYLYKTASGKYFQPILVRVVGEEELKQDAKEKEAI